MILGIGCDSALESFIMNRQLTPYPSKASYIVNPSIPCFMGKIIVVSMPMDLKLLHDLSMYNKIISRINLPECIDHEYEPYPSRRVNEVVRPLLCSDRLIDESNFKSLKFLMTKDLLKVEQPKNIKSQSDECFISFIKNSLNI